MNGSSASKAALLWDESFLWGIMAHRALTSAGLRFEIISSREIREGRLGEFSLLFVPGGWASNKIKALGDGGAQEIRRFVSEGGSYLGFCGGAGLATQDGLGLVSVKRMPTKQRVPSFSGRIQLNTSDHPIWNDISEDNGPASPLTPHPSRSFHAWWPSQFMVDDPTVRILATYGDALPDAFSSDLNVGDVESSAGWERLEEAYRINLDPRRLKDEPAVIEARYGEGRVMASLIHFDTPGDSNGAIVLQNLWEYLLRQRTEVRSQKSESRGQETPLFHSPLAKGGHRGVLDGEINDKTLETAVSGIIAELEAAVNELIDLGQRNFLWFWRNPMLLQWRRGVRGLEYCTLYGMVTELSAVSRQQTAALDSERLKELKDRLLSFIGKAKKLLVRERLALQESSITYKRCEDTEIQTMRSELFSSSKSYGGEFKDLLDELDAILCPLLRDRPGDQ